MKVSAISCNQQNSSRINQNKQKMTKVVTSPLKQQEYDSVTFQGKLTKTLATVAGGAAGGALGAATISSGSMVVLASLASGPVGWALLGLYAGGGALLGGAFAKTIAESVDSND